MWGRRAFDPAAEVIGEETRRAGVGEWGSGVNIPGLVSCGVLRSAAK